jgi:hypothetical protein
MGWRARRDTTVLLPEWIPAPGDAFIPDGDGWKPEFTVRLHKNLAGVRKTIATAEEQVFQDWHP